MKRREVEERLALYEDLEGILGAMRSFALAELHRLGRREEAQQAVTGALAKTMADLAPALPQEPLPRRDVWLLLGSVRGFCGTFNEDVVQRWRQEAGEDTPTVVVGERLVSLLPPRAGLFPVPGVLGGQDAPAAIDHILAAVAEARAGLGNESGLVVCLRDMDETRCQRLLPFARPEPSGRALPWMQEAAPQLALKVAQQALFHRLLALLLRAVRAENHMRLLQMENALEHLERGRDELQRQRNRLRQEEIVEEIEVMISARHRQFG
ncbi:MAG: F0F1 ATP synthase subunit gamma [Betaproteobacteria bacterium]|nr:F0F1 ATP synthase subunit gamma [Betaproteobacteria bacterium]